MTLQIIGLLSHHCMVSKDIRPQPETWSEEPHFVVLQAFLFTCGHMVFSRPTLPIQCQYQFCHYFTVPIKHFSEYFYQ